MTPSSQCYELIKQFEGCKLTAYPDPATKGDPWTIGVGHTGKDVHPGLTISEEQANRLLQADVAKFAAGVSKLGTFTQNQFDALVSFAFNLGLTNLQNSTLLKKHLAGDYAAARLEFLRWDKAAGKQMPGLTRRRVAESNLYALA